jgi:hypothetical protein
MSYPRPLGGGKGEGSVRPHLNPLPVGEEVVQKRIAKIPIELVFRKRIQDVEIITVGPADYGSRGF